MRGHRHTEGQFCSLGDSGTGSWVVSSECRIMRFTKPPCSARLLGEPDLTKKLRRPWQGLLVCPRCSAWAPPEEYWQILEMMVSRGDRTPPVASLPEDTSLQPSPQVPSSPQWTRSLTPLQRPTPYKSQPPPACLPCHPEASSAFTGSFFYKHFKNCREHQELS